MASSKMVVAALLVVMMAGASGQRVVQRTTRLAQMPTIPVSNNYAMASNADDLITKALENGTLSAAQVSPSSPSDLPLSSGARCYFSQHCIAWRYPLASATASWRRTAPFCPFSPSTAPPLRCPTPSGI